MPSATTSGRSLKSLSNNLLPLKMGGNGANRKSCGGSTTLRTCGSLGSTTLRWQKRRANPGLRLLLPREFTTTRTGLQGQSRCRTFWRWVQHQRLLRSASMLEKTAGQKDTTCRSRFRKKFRDDMANGLLRGQWAPNTVTHRVG